MPRAIRIPVFIRGLLLVVVMGSLSGCGTILSQRNYWARDLASPIKLSLVVDGVWVYGGTLSDIKTLLLVLPFVDLPFSIAADTVLLPLTVTQQIVGRPSSVRDESVSQSFSQRAIHHLQQPPVRQVRSGHRSCEAEAMCNPFHPPEVTSATAQSDNRT